jgi:predicted DNA-binding transcriptional regulator AlpA
MTTIKVAELPPILRFGAAAKAIGVSRTTLDRWVAAERVCKPRTLSPRIRVFDTAALLASLQDSPQE